MAPQAAVITLSDFPSRLRALKQLKKEAMDTYRVATAAILAFAVAYTKLSTDAEGDDTKKAQLGSVVPSWQATRWHRIASQVEHLKPIQHCIPASFEAVYDVSRAMNKNRQRVLQAATGGTLTPESTTKAIQALVATRTYGASGSVKSPTITNNRLKSVGITFRIRLDHIPRWDEIEALRDVATKALAKSVGDARFVEFSDTTLQEQLETYWELKDEGVKLKQAGSEAEKADLVKRWKAARFEGSVWS